MAKLEDLLRGLRLQDLPEKYADLAPILTALEAAVSSIGNAIAGGNLTLDDNAAVEKLEVQLTHGVAQTASLKKLRRCGAVIGFACGEDASGTAHAFMFPPTVKPTSTPGVVSVTGHFRNNTAKRVKCSIWLEPSGVSSSKTASATTDPILTGSAAGGDLGATYPNPTVLATHLSSPLPLAQGGTANTSGQPSGTAGGDLGGTYPSPTVLSVADVTTGVLKEANGGTNQSTYAQGDLLYASAANTLAKLAKGTSGQLLQIGASIPAWAGEVAWTAVAGGVGFANAWVDIANGTDFACGFLKDASGFVHLRGTMKSGTIGLAAFTLPAGYRPSARMSFAVDSNGAYGSFLVTSAGVVTPQTGTNVRVDLSGITFDTR